MPERDRLRLSSGAVFTLERAVLVLVALLALAVPALAHPHIFIDAHARIVFDADGAVSEIHNTWVFDEAYSSWAIQGLDTNNDGNVSVEEMQPLADDNLQGLSEYGFYTFAGEGKTISNSTLCPAPPTPMMARA